MARWLGIDHGTKRIGVAVGETASRIATPLAQLSAQDPGAAQRIAEWAAEYGAVGAVVGWPLRADGSEGSQGRIARQYALGLAKQAGLDVRLWDERLSSFEADERLRGRLTRRQKKRRHDAVAAAAFLEDFLAHGGPESAPPAREAHKRLPEAQ